MLHQGCMISNELPQIKETLTIQMEEWRTFLTHFIQEMKNEGIVGSPLDARTIATAGMVFYMDLICNTLLTIEFRFRIQYLLLSICFNSKNQIRKINTTTSIQYF
ncbi:hypothetical protein Q8G35_17605 [Peribacillus simplex]|uniref:Uncharacterized protein n=2 Tax=Peribacillus TaxID=2675229 RepID=A0AA90PD88_9BACI|nr:MULTISPECIES: hypothetical protein [Peribacillus]MDP1420157.1 hypothetical protein [Peribacillus simplex]MDP1453753.1 hypothetical protein [Peribacillus frigoritolerans]